eukprot:CAMPEP_0170272836 /NCGR_PEP_ID=MMETSP0116_2-20130129/36378_1 /TAXON_ID=400756 /ORGANISM="Durinskia baltica, Strain CSIRO CS-38" /LENGTH=186 /DNA_ID=CAMNT_0010524059 /DNA_START=85 /DNA_END=641 /DNA_ORIENTATION=+
MAKPGSTRPMRTRINITRTPLCFKSPPCEPMSTRSPLYCAAAPSKRICFLLGLRHVQRWQKAHCSPSLQPRGVLTNLHAAAQAKGCPAQPKEAAPAADCGLRATAGSDMGLPSAGVCVGLEPTARSKCCLKRAGMQSNRGGGGGTRSEDEPARSSGDGVRIRAQATTTLVLSAASASASAGSGPSG